MCGRIALHTPPNRLARLLDARVAADVDGDAPPRYNLAPTDEVLALVVRRPRPDGDPAAEQTDADAVARERLIESFRWGFVPHWAKDPSVGNRMINARSESVATTGAFRDALRRHRCLVICDGFYEWYHAVPKAPGTRRAAGDPRGVPHFFERTDGEPMLLAGLWSNWWDPARPDGPDAWVRSCAVITTPGGDDVAAVHDRMPVIVEGGDVQRWLDREILDPGEVADVLHPAPRGTLMGHRVRPLVDNTRNDGPELIEPDEPAPDLEPPVVARALFDAD